MTTAGNPALAAAGLLKSQSPVQSAGAGLMAQAGQGPQAFPFMPSALPTTLPTGPVRPLPLQVPKFV